MDLVESVKDSPRGIDIVSGMVNEVLTQLGIGPVHADSDGWIILKTPLKQRANELNQANILLLCRILIFCHTSKLNIPCEWSDHS